MGFFRPRLLLSCRRMSAPAEIPAAWEPLTPRGVAAFTAARLSRLLLVQFVIASLAAMVVVRFLSDGCFPVVREAIQHLPESGAIRSGRLDCPDDSPRLLAGGRFLAFVIDPGHGGQVQSSADVQIEFGRETVRVNSLFGYAEWDYPTDWIIAFNRTELEPLWGAWEPEWLAITVLSVVAGLMLSWALLATICFLPAWLIGFLTSRRLNFRSSWKLSGAALLPGALLFIAAIAAYDFGVIDLIQFCFFFGAHFVLGWIYLVISQFFLPRVDARPSRANPFAPPPIH